jgi:hypothetical protein
MLVFKGPIGIADSAPAELMVLFKGVKPLAIQYKFIPLLVEGDSENAISWVRTGNFPWQFVYLVSKICDWADEYQPDFLHVLERLM